MDEPGNDQRTRVPRVDMHYNVDVNGVRRRVDLPFVTGVLADLAGQPEYPLPPVAERRFVDVDVEGFDAFVAEIAPRLLFRVPDLISGEGHLPVDLKFHSLDDFAPRAIVRRLPALAQALKAAGPDDEAAVRQVAAEVDAILHHAAFQRLEAAWRALYRLVAANETGSLSPIRVMVISKLELAKTLKRYKGTAWDQSPIFKRVYTDGIGSPGGQPMGCLVLDFEFDHSLPDVETLRELAKVGAAGHTSVLVAASPGLFQMSSWQEIESPRDLAKIMTRPEYQDWHSLRESDDARSIVLVMPRYLERAPWRGVRIGIASQLYDETQPLDGQASLLWANPAYLLAAVIQRSYRIHGWFAHIGGLASGGAVEGLARADVAGDGERTGIAGPAEFPLSDRRLGELARLGTVSLAARGHSGIAVFDQTPTLSKPAEYDDPDATTNAKLAAHLSYQLMICRIAHFMKAMLRDMSDLQGLGRLEVERFLQDWLAGYAEQPPGAPNAFAGRPRPLEVAEVTVEELPEHPGIFNSRFYIRPRGMAGRGPA